MKRNYATLDGIRGLAALLIVIRHASVYFGSLHATESFLAVDLFFVLSGFVLCHAYQERFDAGLTTLQFLKLRIVRLYPLYLLGLALGVVAAGIAAATGRDAITWGQTAAAAAFGLVMLPSPLTGAKPQVYPLNPPSWSLFFELAVNAAMALLWKRLTNRVLLAICAGSGVALAGAVAWHGSADAGYAWDTLWIGALRVSFSFCLGMLIHRRRDRIRWSLPPWVILVMVGIGLGYSPPAALRAGYDIAMILAGFPILVASAIGREPIIGSGTFRLLGIASYAIYVLHYPAQRLVRAVVQVLTHRDVADFAPWSGLVLLLALVGGCWAVDKIYDQPIRRWLGTRVNQARRDRSSAARPARRGCGEP